MEQGDFVRRDMIMPKIYFEVIKDAGDDYKQTGEFSEDVLMCLQDLFQETLHKALKVLDKYTFTRLANEHSTRALHFVAHSSKHHLLFDEINYCQCKTFKESVLSGKLLVCEHILALDLAKCTGLVKDKRISNVEMTRLLNGQNSSALCNWESSASSGLSQTNLMD